METYTEPKKLVKNIGYQEQKQQMLAGLTDGMIDAPIIGLIKTINRLPYCFTLQCCYGHFTYNSQNNTHNLEPLPRTEKIERVEYRIAYIAFCIEHSAWGRSLIAALNKITHFDPEYIQLCSAEWFWERQVNSYALQVEPDRFKHQDRVILDYDEALHVETTRNQFFDHLRELFLNLLESSGYR
ncbi:MAG: hypothetical protein SWH54_12615 [Thermodesulfobacteriota bacterium]|nr:hypothetical protein [Thermodesulfobacteriota bacterium]